MTQTSKLIGKLLGTVALVGATALSTPAFAETKDFKAGSLIIPATSVFQTDCGSVSMYGLIYNVLRANAWLDADPGYGPIEVYYAYNTSTGTYGELSVQPDGLIVPLVQNYLPSTDEYVWVETSGNGLYAEIANLQYDIAPLPSGLRLVVELWVVDFGGNAAYVSSVVAVP